MHANEPGEGNQRGHSSVCSSKCKSFLQVFWKSDGTSRWQIGLKPKSVPAKENSPSRICFQPWPREDQPVFHHAVNSIRTGIFITCDIFWKIIIAVTKEQSNWDDLMGPTENNKWRKKEMCGLELKGEQLCPLYSLACKSLKQIEA